MKKIVLVLFVFVLVSNVFAQNNSKTQNWFIIHFGSMNFHTGGGISLLGETFGIELLAGIDKKESAFDLPSVDAERYEGNILFKFREGPSYIIYSGGGIILWKGSSVNERNNPVEDKWTGFSLFVGGSYYFGKIGIGGKVGYQSAPKLNFRYSEGVKTEYVSGGGVSHGISQSSGLYQIFISLRL